MDKLVNELAVAIAVGVAALLLFLVIIHARRSPSGSILAGLGLIAFALYVFPVGLLYTGLAESFDISYTQAQVIWAVLAGLLLLVGLSRLRSAEST